MTRAPSTSELLEIWDRGVDRGWIDRALAMLEVASGEPRDALAVLPVGERDARLCALRRRLFGAKMQALAECPACSETLESTLDLDALMDEGERSEATAVVAHEGIELHLRLPTSVDLTQALASHDAEDARTALLVRCVRAVGPTGEGVDVERLPREAIDAATRALARIAPRAHVDLDFVCAACGHAWQTPFDIVSFLWREIDAQARRLLHEVHVLASAYGWRESDVLDLSPRRRRAYLEMVRT